MSRKNLSGSAYNHSIKMLALDTYRISWTVDRYSANSRIANPSYSQRVTDKEGAKRFNKKHNLNYQFE